MKIYMYLVMSDLDVDGGFGDAIPTKEPVILFHQKELAEKYVKENSNPHVYDTPYSALYEGGLHVEKVELGD